MRKMADVQGKTALITGAGSGIGRAVAIRLAEEGIRCILVGRRRERLEETRALIGKLRGQADVVPGDVTDGEFRERCLRECQERTGRLDILINDAGMALNCPFERTAPEQFDALMEVNARAPYFLCQKALPYLRKSDMPTIINIASVTAHKGYVDQSAYTASKHALMGFTKSLAAEVYKEGIRVHLISPGGVYTDMVRIARPDLPPEGMILAEDIAEAAAYLILHRNSNAVIDEISIHRANKEPFL